jgi:hypothetical protein
MMHTNSLRYDHTGRKRKTKALNKCKKLKRTFKEIEVRSVHPNYEDQVHYKSTPLTTPTQTMQDDSYKKEISSKYTVSIAYNKGTYQVVPNSDIKHIGK